MYKLILLFVLLLTHISCTKSEEPHFNIIRFDLNKSKDLTAYKNWREENQVISNKTIKDTLKFTDGTIAGTLFYEDQEYRVFTDCQGEFGGSLIFQKKKNKQVLFYLESVCPVMIEKRKDGYYIVESLAHMGGSGCVKFIKDPKSLVCIDLNHLTPDWKLKKFPSLSGFEIDQKLRHQGKVLVGGYGIMCSMLFEHKNKNYVIYSKDEKTLLGQIKADTLFPIDTLFRYGSYHNLDNYKYAVKNYRHYEFHTKNWSIGVSKTDIDESFGEIYVRNNIIVCAYSNRKWSTRTTQL